MVVFIQCGIQGVPSSKETPLGCFCESELPCLLLFLTNLIDKFINVVPAFGLLTSTLSNG